MFQPMNFNAYFTFLLQSNAVLTNALPGNLFVKALNSFFYVLKLPLGTIKMESNTLNHNHDRYNRVREQK